MSFAIPGASGAILGREAQRGLHPPRRPETSLPLDAQIGLPQPDACVWKPEE